jgi:hypothetical protein
MSHARFERRKVIFSTVHSLVQQYVIDKITADKEKGLREQALDLERKRGATASQSASQLEALIQDSPMKEDLVLPQVES